MYLADGIHFEAALRASLRLTERRRILYDWDFLPIVLPCKYYINVISFVVSPPAVRLVVHLHFFPTTSGASFSLPKSCAIAAPVTLGLAEDQHFRRQTSLQ